MKNTILFLFALLPVWALAQNESCEEEIKIFCPNEPKQLKQLECLLKHEKELSNKCKQELQRLSKVAKETGVRSGGGLSSFGGVIGGLGLVPPQKRVITYTGSMAPQHDRLDRHKMSFSTPVWSQGKESFSLSLGAGSLNFQEKYVLDKKQVEVPKNYNRVELGANYSKALKNSRMLGLRASIGSASDKVFHSSRELIFSMNASYAYPGKDKNDFWMLTVFMSNNNPLANFVPIPGFVYFHKTEKFTGMFGLPFASMQWTPVDPWLFSFSLFVTNINLEAAYGHRDQIQFYTGFNMAQEAYLRVDRDRALDRLFLDEKKIFVGARAPLSKNLFTDLQFGQSFDRKVFEGRSYGDRRMGEDTLKNSLYGTLSLNVVY